jgi:hypothetical protein
MATTIVKAPIKITIKEEITLDGVEYNYEDVLTIDDIASVFRQIIPIPQSEVIILAMGSAVAAGQFVETKVMYIRITNKDDANFVTLIFRDETGAEFAVKLDYGQSFIYSGDREGGVVDTMDADSSALTVGLADLVDITANANSASVDLELIVVGI